MTATNRSLQWREKVVDPRFESLPDHTIMYRLATELGIADEMFRNISMQSGEPQVEDITREINRGAWTIGCTGQSPERLKKQMANQHTFNKKTLRADHGPCRGEYYGLPWPCWGTPELGHPGTAPFSMIRKSLSQTEGLVFAHDSVWSHPKNLVASTCLARAVRPVWDIRAGNVLKDGHPEYTMAMLEKLGWDGDLTSQERQIIASIAGGRTNGKRIFRAEFNVSRSSMAATERQRQGARGDMEFSGPCRTTP